MVSSRVLLGLLCLVLASAYIVNAQADDIAVDSLPEDLGFSSPDVKHSTIFPDHPTKSFATATVLDSYTRFQNLGQKFFNITSIYGSINYLQDPNVYLQNLTRLRYDTIVQPSEQVTFEFQFVADASLEPRDYHLLIRADYFDVSNGFMYTTTFVNSTITVVENAAVSDMTGPIVTLVVILASVGYVAYTWFQKKAAKTGKKSALDEDLAGTNVRIAKSPKGKSN